MQTETGKPTMDHGAAIVAALLAATALATLWQAQAFTPFASIFPRAVGIALLLCSLLVLWRVWRGTAPASRGLVTEGGNGLLRSGLLVLILLAWVTLLERFGFLLASWGGFFLLALLANRDPLRARRVLLFAVVALLAVLLLQLLFQRGLDVRLPAGSVLPNLVG